MLPSVRLGERKARIILGVTAGGLTSILLLGAPGSADTTLVATIDGKNLTESSATNAIVLDPQRRSELGLQLTNTGDQPVTVHQVLLVGRVMAIRFFSFAYTFQGDIEVPPGESTSTKVPMDIPGIRSQVLGLLPGHLTLYSADGRVIASEDLVIEARGSYQSVYGVLGIAISATTFFGFLTAVLALARHRLSPHRWNRGFRFLLLGLGLGLSLIFAFSVARAVVPHPSTCARIMIISTAVLFVLGFLTPRPPIYRDDVELQPAPAADRAPAAEP